MDTTTPPPNTEPPAQTDQGMRVGPIIRDVVIVWVLTAMGGFVAGVATGGPQRDAQRFMLAIAASNLLLGTVGFTIAGCLAPHGRWRHLCVVAVGVWIAGLINVAFFGVTILQWIGSLIFVAVITGVGGALSHVFKRDPTPSA